MEQNNTPKNTEEFLRKHFGLKGEFYSEEFKAFVKESNESDYWDWDAWWRDHEPDDMFTKEANELWYKFADIAEELKKMSLISEDEEEEIYDWLIENLPEL